MKKAKAVQIRAPKEFPVTSAAEPESCGTCHNWRDEFCKRFPPSKIPGQQIAAHRFATAKTDWCGEWKPLSAKA